MSERTPFDAIERALAELTQGEKERRRQRAEDPVNAWSYAQLNAEEIDELIAAHESE